MEAISFFMLAVAIALVITYATLFFLKKKKICYFFFPTTSHFNIAWGMFFFMTYGALRYRENVSLYFFTAALILSLLSVIYLYLLNNYLNGRASFFNKIISKIVNYQIDKQEELDKKTTSPYSKEKSLMILGITKYQINLDNIKEIVDKKYNILKMLYDDKKIKNPYFLTMIKKSSEALK